MVLSLLAPNFTGNDHLWAVLYSTYLHPHLTGNDLLWVVLSLLAPNFTGSDNLWAGLYLHLHPLLMGNDLLWAVFSLPSPTSYGQGPPMSGLDPFLAIRVLTYSYFYSIADHSTLIDLLKPNTGYRYMYSYRTKCTYNIFPIFYTF